MFLRTKTSRGELALGPDLGLNVSTRSIASCDSSWFHVIRSAPRWNLFYSAAASSTIHHGSRGTRSWLDPLTASVCVCMCGCLLTVLVQEELVEAQAAGLLADEAVHILGAVVVHGDGVLQRFDTRLQTEGDLGVADGVPETQTDTGRRSAPEG